MGCHPVFCPYCNRYRRWVLYARLEPWGSGSIPVEWPYPGSCTLGFVAHRDCRWVMPDNDRMLAVHIPMAPNHTSGYIS